MYGTVARFRIKPGLEEQLNALTREYEELQIPGFITEYVYRMDQNPNELYMAVIFESKEAYVANANHPSQHQRYLKMRELLVEDPEWHDGEVIHSYNAR
jgi:quinol monooxygenase YgiN